MKNKDYDFGWLGVAVKTVFIFSFGAMIIAFVAFILAMCGIGVEVLLVTWKQILPELMDFIAFILLAGLIVVGSWLWRRIKSRNS